MVARACLLLLLVGEEVPRPAERRLRRARLRAAAAAAGDAGTGIGVGEAGKGIRGFGGGRAAAEDLTLGVVFASPGGVREGEVGVVYELEFAGAGGALGRVGGDAVGVGFEGRAEGYILRLFRIIGKIMGREQVRTVCRHLGLVGLLRTLESREWHLRRSQSHVWGRHLARGPTVVWWRSGRHFALGLGSMVLGTNEEERVLKKTQSVGREGCGVSLVSKCVCNM